MWNKNYGNESFERLVLIKNEIASQNKELASSNKMFFRSVSAISQVELTYKPNVKLELYFDINHNSLYFVTLKYKENRCIFRHYNEDDLKKAVADFITLANLIQ